MEIVDVIVMLYDRKNKSMEHQIVNILMILKIFSISQTTVRILLTNYTE